MKYLKLYEQYNLAPNGKESNLSPELYQLVRTTQFKKWFGDWENNHGNASKVVDENGEPLVVYHSSNTEFNIFKPSNMFKGFFFTDNEFDNEFTSDGAIKALDNDILPKWLDDIMKNTGLTKNELKDKLINDSKYKITRPFFLNIRKMYPFSWIGKVSDKNWSTPYFENLYINKAIERGFDGIEFIKEDNNKRIIVVFNPNQIKIADGSNTTFSNSNLINN